MRYVYSLGPPCALISGFKHVGKLKGRPHCCLPDQMSRVITIPASGPAWCRQMPPCDGQVPAAPALQNYVRGISDDSSTKCYFK